MMTNQRINKNITLQVHNQQSSFKNLSNLSINSKDTKNQQQKSPDNHNPNNLNNSHNKNHNKNILQFSKDPRSSNLHEQQINGLEKLSQLSERLKNIHHFYKLRIDQEKFKSSQRNEIFMSIIQELQNTHDLKKATFEQQIEKAEQQKKQVLLVDYKMSSIKGSIDEILKQSALYKSHNQKLEEQITSKQHKIIEKQREAERLKIQMMNYRNQLQLFERLRLKENKRQKQMLEMIGQ